MITQPGRTKLRRTSTALEIADVRKADIKIWHLHFAKSTIIFCWRYKTMEVVGPFSIGPGPHARACTFSFVALLATFDVLVFHHFDTNFFIGIVVPDSSNRIFFQISQRLVIRPDATGCDRRTWQDVCVYPRKHAEVLTFP